MNENTTMLNTPTVRQRLQRPLALPVGIAALAVVMSVVAGYLAGARQSEMHRATVACLSAPGTISCGPVESPGQAEYRVPRDVAWTQDGVFHEGGRPECLPPTGRGTVTVQVTWTEVDVNGTRWKQVVGVHC